MYSLFTFNTVLSRFNETTSKNSNVDGLLTVLFVAAGVGLGVGIICLYKKISNNNALLRRQIDRTDNEIKNIQQTIDEAQEETDLTRQSIDHLNQEVQVAQRQLEKLQQKSSETERILTDLESSTSYKSR